VSPASRLQIDTAAFYGRYRDLRQDASFTAVESTPAPTHLVIGTRWENGDGAATSGIETLARWSVLPGWRIDGSYSWFRVQFNDRKAANPINANTPAHQWQVSSRLDLPRNSEFDTTIFWVDQLDAFHILSYTRVDARFKYVLFPGVSLYLVGQNLLDPSHQEFGDSEGSIATEVPRTVSAKLMWRF
jgi:iron complex outermembrane receptor protein